MKFFVFILLVRARRSLSSSSNVENLTVHFAPQCLATIEMSSTSRVPLGNCQAFDQGRNRETRSNEEYKYDKYFENQLQKIINILEQMLNEKIKREKNVSK